MKNQHFFPPHTTSCFNPKHTELWSQNTTETLFTCDFNKLALKKRDYRRRGITGDGGRRWNNMHIMFSLIGRHVHAKQVKKEKKRQRLTIKQINKMCKEIKMPCQVLQCFCSCGQYSEFIKKVLAQYWLHISV